MFIINGSWKKLEKKNGYWITEIQLNSSITYQNQSHKS